MTTQRDWDRAYAEASGDHRDYWQRYKDEPSPDPRDPDPCGETERYRTPEIKIADAAYFAACEAIAPQWERESCIGGGVFVVVDLAQAQKIDLVLFVRAAGDVGGEALFRFGAAKGMHALSGEDWPRINPAVCLFFEVFAAVTKAIAPLIDPPIPASEIAARTGAC